MKKKILAISILAALAMSAMTTTAFAADPAAGSASITKTITAGTDGGDATATWEYGAATQEANKLDGKNGVKVGVYAKVDLGTPVGTDVDGNPIYEGDKYSVQLDWKDSVYQYNYGEWDTENLKWKTDDSKWDNTAEHNEISITNYSSHPIKVQFEATSKTGYDSITYSFDDAAKEGNTVTPNAITDLKVASADQGKGNSETESNQPVVEKVYLNLDGNPPVNADISAGNTPIGDITITIVTDDAVAAP